MTPDVFAANRGKRLDEVDAELLPVVKKALEHWSARGDWYESIVDGASVLWLEMFEESVPDAKPKERDDLLAAFQKDLRDTLAKTSDPKTAASTQAQTITEWVSTSTANHAELRAARVNQHPALRWVTRKDNRVRATHRAIDGTTVPAGQTFKVGDVHLAYPGEPVGSPANWIHCRCILQRVGEGKSMAGNATAFTEDSALIAAADKTPADAEGTMPDEMTTEDVHEDDLLDAATGTEIPFHGVAAPTDVASGDNRQLSSKGFSTRPLPLPLAYQRGSYHGGDAGPAVTVGRIDNIFLDEASGLVMYEGAFSPNITEASEAIQHVVDGTMRGVSVDVDAAVMAQVDPEDEATRAAAEAGTLVTVFDQWRVAGITMVSIPAFHEAFIALGPIDDQEPDAADPNEAAEPADEEFADTSAEGRRKSADKGHAMPDGSYPIENVQDLQNAIQAIGRAKDPAAAKKHIKKRANDLGHPEMIPEGWTADVEVFAPGTHDGPGWITHPVPTARIRRYWVRGKGAAKINWGVPGDFNRCRAELGKYVANPEWLAGLCANMHKEAIGLWPGQEDGGRHSIVAAGAKMAAAINLVASAAPNVPPGEWFLDPELDGPTPFTVTDDGRVFGHVATWGTCHIGFDQVCTTAPSSSSGYAYYRTGEIDTTLGPVSVGQVTMGAGHADLRAGAQAAAAHYDNVAHAVADVSAGEDAHGIWVAGALRPGLADEDVRALRAASLSGDWRRIRGGMEMVAALAVNVPGFPIPRNSIAASGQQQLALVAAGVVQEESAQTEDFDGRVQVAVERALARREKVAAARARVAAATRTARLARARRIGR